MRSGGDIGVVSGGGGGVAAADPLRAPTLHTRLCVHQVARSCAVPDRGLPQTRGLAHQIAWGDLASTGAPPRRGAAAAPTPATRAARRRAATRAAARLAAPARAPELSERWWALCKKC